MSERETQNAILAALARQTLLFRSNAGKWFNVPNPCPACAAKGRWIQGMPAGAPDLMGIVRGTGAGLAVEVKSDTGKQRPEQRDFEAAWTRSGGIYVLARSAEEAIASVEAKK